MDRLPVARAPGSDASSVLDIARHRRTDPRSLAKQLRGDLDWVVMKCLEKERARRYETANGLAADIQRHLSDEPVVASPPSASYRFRKFARRNKRLLGSVTGIAAALVIGLTLATYGFITASNERDQKEMARAAEAEQRTRAETAEREARQEADRARAVSGFLQDVLAAPSPYGERRDLAVEDLLTLASTTVSEALAGQPTEEASIRRTLGQTYANLGLLEEADLEFQRAIDLYTRAGDAHWRDRSVTVLRRCGVLNEQSRWDELIDAAGVLRDQVNALDRPDAELFEEVTLQLAGAYRRSKRDPDYAEVLYREALESQRSRLGDSDVKTIRTMAGLGLCLIELGEYEEGTALIRRAHSFRRRALGSHHPDTLGSIDQLGWALIIQGDHAAAEPILREGARLHRRVMGPDHPLTLQIEMNHATALERLGRWEELLPVARSAFEAQRRKFGDDYRRTKTLARLTAQALFELGRTEELAELCGIVLPPLRRDPPGADASAQELNDFAWKLVASPCIEVAEPGAAKRQAELAMPFAERAVSIKRESGGNLVWQYLDTLAMVHFRRGDYVKAVAVQREALSLWAESSGDQTQWHAEFEARLAQYEAALEQGAEDD